MPATMMPVHGSDTRWLLWECPGCRCSHGLVVGEDERTLYLENAAGGRTTWTWNGSVETPTIRASLLHRARETCHYFVTDGFIEFLGDCTHEFAGQRVEMRPLHGGVLHDPVSAAIIRAAEHKAVGDE